MSFHIPTKNNVRLKRVLDRIQDDAELIQLWKSANVNAVDRSGINDHGEVHIRIASNAALRILRLLVRGGVEPSVVKNYGLETTTQRSSWCLQPASMISGSPSTGTTMSSTASFSRIRRPGSS